MAGVVHTARLSARLASRYAARCAPRRGFRVSAQDRAAQNYTMPALSPTMTEGSISSWTVKEGQSFSAGDVILEIETDKATMDVEAQDDGVLFKITKPDGSKGVKVGERIAVIAEQGDDLDSLEMPAEDKSAIMSQPEKTEQPEQREESSAASAEKKDSSEAGGKAPQPASKTADDAGTKGMGGKAQKQQYPLFPAVQQLLHLNNLSNEDADTMPASGPGGRLLKGDVLAYLGQVPKDYPAQSSARLEKLSHLDLSNIQIAKPQPKPEATKATAPPELELPTDTEIAIPISLSAVIATQKRVQDTLGIFLPLSTFIARASELANEGLPPNTSQKPTADDLFNSVLGLDQVPKFSRGHFIPQITGILPPPPVAAVKVKLDIIDILAPKAAKPNVSPATVIPNEVGVSVSGNIFSVTAKLGDESRATEYLERMKLALEREPGRLVL